MTNKETHQAWKEGVQAFAGVIVDAFPYLRDDIHRNADALIESYEKGAVGEPKKNTVGNRLRQARLIAGLSQSQFATRFRPARATNTISRWETGTYSMQLEDVEQAAAILGISPAVLVGWYVDEGK